MGTNSSLALYTRLSPNCTKPRNAHIDTITPHCVAGNLSIEATLGLDCFITPDSENGASCNYAIGSDGRVGLGVVEENRAWTSSSRANDHRAITIEIANDGGSPNWHMSDEAIEGFICLSMDICKRYSWKGVYWDPDKDNPHRGGDYMRITLHQWFANKSCPGPYFISRIPAIVEEINKRMMTAQVTQTTGEYTDPTEALTYWKTAGVLSDTAYWAKKCKATPWLGLAFSKMADYAKKK